MKSLILILNHGPREKIEFHRQWHSRICDTKVIWQTDRIVLDNELNVYAIDVPGNIIIPAKMRIYCHYAAKFDYDYFVFLDGDAFILIKDFIPNVIKYMQEKKADVCFTHLSDHVEHYKAIFYDLIRKEYGIEKIMWSLNACTIASSDAVKKYNEKNYYKIYDEVDFVNCIAAYSSTEYVLYPDIDYEVFYAGEIFGKVDEYIKQKRPKDFSKINIIHAVKDYKGLAKYGIDLR